MPPSKGSPMVTRFSWRYRKLHNLENADSETVGLTCMIADDLDARLARLEPLLPLLEHPWFKEFLAARDLCVCGMPREGHKADELHDKFIPKVLTRPGDGKLPDSAESAQLKRSEEPRPEPSRIECVCIGSRLVTPPGYHEPQCPMQTYASVTDSSRSGPSCRACGTPLLPENIRVADGCPCNSARGVNHGLVPELTCTCVVCDPGQSGSTRYPPLAPAEVETADEFAARLGREIFDDGLSDQEVVQRIAERDIVIRADERRKYEAESLIPTYRQVCETNASLRLRAERAEAERDEANDQANTLGQRCERLEQERDAAMRERDQARRACDFDVGDRDNREQELAAAESRIAAALKCAEDFDRGDCVNGGLFAQELYAILGAK